jgi:hypothetical protein
MLYRNSKAFIMIKNVSVLTAFILIFSWFYVQDFGNFINFLPPVSIAEKAMTDPSPSQGPCNCEFSSDQSKSVSSKVQIHFNGTPLQFWLSIVVGFLGGLIVYGFGVWASNRL